MKYHYDFYTTEPIIRDYPVYDATALEYGELLMLGTTDPDSGADESRALVSAFNATAANSAIDSVGILNEETYGTETGNGVAPSTAYSLAGGGQFGKVIINPFAIYRAEVDQTDAVAITSTSGTTLTVGSLADDIDGYHVYFVGTTSGVTGSLRSLLASAAGSATMDSALTTAGTGSDTIIIIPPSFQYAPNLNAEATGLTTDAAAPAGATNLRVVQSYIEGTNNVAESLRISNGSGINGLAPTGSSNAPVTKFWVDIVQKDHLFGVQE